MNLAAPLGVSFMVAALAASSPAETAAECNPVGKVQFVCLTEGAEDIAHVPNSDWVIVSGVLRAINAKDHSEIDLFAAVEKFDKKT